MTLRIEAVIPAHNEAGSIAGVVEGLKSFGLQRILVVDDASEDGTGDAARAAGAEVLRLAPGEGGGKGQVMQRGIRQIQGDSFDYYLFLDGDGQHDPADFARFLARLEAEPGLDFLVGSRKDDSARIPKSRWRTNALGTWTLSRISGVVWEDSQSGFRMIKKKVLDRMEIRGQGFTFEMEISMKAAHRKIRWAHVPIQAIYHPGEPRSHFRGVLDTWLIAWFSLWC